MSNVSTAEAFATFQQTLQARGPREALVYLNGLTDYRYTGVFRFDAGFAHSLYYVDRVNPEVHSIPGIPENATYCCYVRDSRGQFTTLDALIDERLDDHPARQEVRGYCGIPVLDPEGVLLGTLCHFDEMPRDSTQIDLDLLLQVASELARHGQVPRVGAGLSGASSAP